MTAPASKFRGTSPTAPGGLLAPTQTAQAVASDGAAGGAGEVSEQEMAATRPVVPKDLATGRTLLPLVLLVLLWSVFVGAVCWDFGFEYGWDRAYPLGVDEGARAVTIEAYQQGREVGQDEGYRTGRWDCRIESGRVL